MALGRSYGVVQGNIPMQPGDFWLECAGDNITAHAGGGQTAAFPVTTQTVRVTTVATAGDSIMLPPSVPGLEMLVINHGANAMQVYGSGTDQIDDVATATGVSQMAGSFVLYSCATAGNWYSEGLATGFARGTSLQTFSYTAGVTAHAGGGQANGVPVVAMMTQVSTVTSGNDSITLPASAPGMNLVVTNSAAANSLNIFPNAGGTTTEAINAIAANSAFALTAGKSVEFVCYVAGQWYTVPLVP